ncbi:phosphatase PAP2 family protein [Saccharospirillum salsuginis]|uniref:undecaprenyl-diphosphate phosphatase n=1 Tax=Saccharospirillum salsuginis TaxID=418750 RepID=A0A918K7Q9_9GAMM|nr:phosphatase PAP2 family protein [Saccharospirillum salsuginis]GGX53851.1 phosphoesterase [Saccharospirillum salsuginis]
MMLRSMTLAILLGLASATPADEWTTAGDVLQIALPLTALTATFTLDDPEGRTALVGSYATTLGASYVLKYTVDRERPDGSDTRSFPSAHTASAFSGASFLQRRYGWDIGLPAYLGATYVGWSRVYGEKHYVSDVLAGAALAWGVNYWLVPKSDRRDFALVPMQGGAALAFNFRF